jgi:aldehyde dehydrogenase (NAD+)
MSTHTTINVPSLGDLEIPTGIFINNEFRPSSSGETIPTICPATAKPIVEIAHATKEDVDEAVKAAREAFNTTWGNNVAGAERGALLMKLADLMERDAEKLSALERCAQNLVAQG